MKKLGYLDPKWLEDLASYMTQIFYIVCSMVNKHINSDLSPGT